MKRFWNIFIMSWFVLTLWGQSYTVETIPDPQTVSRNNYVSNPDGILQAGTVSQINQKIDSIRNISGTEIAVVAVNSIGVDDINDFANRLYNYWKIGQEKQSNGVLVLLVMDAHGIVIRTGYGVEGILPDAISKRIINNVIIPSFKEGNYDKGLLDGITSIVNIVKGESFEIETKEPVRWNEVIPYAIAAYILIALLTWLWLRTMINDISKNKRLATNLARYKAIGEQNTATFSITSFIIPAIGFFLILFFFRLAYILLLLPIPITAIPAYIYGIRKKNEARRAPIPCNECGGTMRMLPENEEDTRLKLSQQFEEKLNTVDYDVFVCDGCKNEAIFSLEKFNSYSRCPKCNTKAYTLVSKKVITAPTYINSGTQRSTYKCKFCGYENHTDTKLPRLTRSNAFTGGAVGGSVFSGRGGFSGGGGGGWGGGMTGGGGASGRW